MHYSMVFLRYKYLMVDMIKTVELRTSPTNSTSQDSNNIRTIKSIQIGYRWHSPEICFQHLHISTPSICITMASEIKGYPSPLQKSGVLDSKFQFGEVTLVIGREYASVNIVDDILNAADTDEPVLQEVVDRAT